MILAVAMKSVVVSLSGFLAQLQSDGFVRHEITAKCGNHPEAALLGRLGRRVLVQAEVLKHRVNVFGGGISQNFFLRQPSSYRRVSLYPRPMVSFQV